MSRRFAANSDSHEHHTEHACVNFWPGEYAKRYVYALKNHASILGGLRLGRIFVTTGDLLSELHVEVVDPGDESRSARIGGTLLLTGAGRIQVRIRARNPGGANHNGDSPVVERIDLIVFQKLIGTETGRLSA